MELVSSERRLQKLFNKCTFKHGINYTETLSAVALENKMIKFDKPIYYIGKYTFLNYTFIIYLITYLLFTGFVVLDISKTLMYDLSVQCYAETLW